MVDFLGNLPAPQHTTDSSLVASDPSLASYSLVPSSIFPIYSSVSSNQNKTAITSKQSQRIIPPYGYRSRWIPRCVEDFGDGGSYPEVQVAQFPLEMGRTSTSSQAVVALQAGEDGKLNYDAVIRQGLSHRTAIYTKPSDAKPKWTPATELQKPSLEEEEDIQKRTKAALDAALAKKSVVGFPKSANKEPEYIKYTPSQQAPGHNADCAQRIVRMVEAQIDPMEPPKHRHKRVPARPPSPPPAILHSPPSKSRSEKDKLCMAL